MLSVSEYSSSDGWPDWAAERNADWHDEAAGRKLQLVSKGDPGLVAGRGQDTEIVRSGQAVGWA